MPKGSCLCKAVDFEVTGELPAASACHCTICRKHTGHFEAGVDVDSSGSTNLALIKKHRILILCYFLFLLPIVLVQSVEFLNPSYEGLQAFEIFVQ